MQNAGLDKAQAGINIAGRNIINLRYADETNLMSERRAGALGRPRGMEWGGMREEGSGWGTHIYLWRIHFDIWQN